MNPALLAEHIIAINHAAQGVRAGREQQICTQYWDVDSCVQAIWAHRSYVRDGSITTPNGGTLTKYYPTDAVRDALVIHNRERAEALRHTIRRPGAPFFEHAVRFARQLRAPESYTQPRRGKTKAEYEASKWKAPNVEAIAREWLHAFGGPLPFSRCVVRPLVPGVQVMDEGFIRGWIEKASRPKTLVGILKELGCEECHVQTGYDGLYYVWCDPQYHLPAAAEFEKHRTIGVQVVFSRFDRPIRALSKQITSDAEAKTDLQEQRDAANKRARELANNLDTANKALQGFSAQLSDARRLLESAQATSLKHSESVEVLQAQRDAAYKALDDVKQLAENWQRLDTHVSFGAHLQQLLNAHGIH